MSSQRTCSVGLGVAHLYLLRPTRRAAPRRAAARHVPLVACDHACVVRVRVRWRAGARRAHRSTHLRRDGVHLRRVVRDAGEDRAARVAPRRVREEREVAGVHRVEAAREEHVRALAQVLLLVVARDEHARPHDGVRGEEERREAEAAQHPAPRQQHTQQRAREQPLACRPAGGRAGWAGGGQRVRRGI